MIEITINSPKHGPHQLLLDEEDVELLERNKYCVRYRTSSPYSHENPRFEGFRRVSRGKRSERKTIYLHREILERKLGITLNSEDFADHIDGNVMNNTRDNLRLANCKTNSYNRRTQMNNTSGYKGVTYLKERGTWKAEITKDRKRVYLGAFKTKEEAGRVYRDAAEELFGEFVRKD